MGEDSTYTETHPAQLPSPRRLRTRQDGSIRAGGGQLKFERAPDGAVNSFTVNAGRVTNIRFGRR